MKCGKCLPGISVLQFFLPGEVGLLFLFGTAKKNSPSVETEGL